jgi:membrane-associated protease RseP (regulator of RpoE activity)
MPREMRFCRSCGNRLGEGPAEYTETVRFPGATGTRPSGTTPFYPSVNAPLSQQSAGQFKPRRRRLGFSGMTWMWIILAVFFVGGGLMSAIRKNVTRTGGITSSANTKSYVGVDDFDSTPGGVTFDSVELPGGPADKAGMVGGDIVTSFDSHPINDEGGLTSLLARTPIGKTVEITYLRDGITHTTQLTTISRDEYNRLDREFSNRPEGKGKFGFESDRMTRISNPATKTFGVQIDWVEPNGPASLFGVKEGDIITDFDNVPIRTEQEFLSRVRRAIPYKTVYIGLIREGQRMVIPVKIAKA